MQKASEEMKVALVHDWLVSMRGAERCLEVFCESFPDADVFTLVHRKGQVSSVIENILVGPVHSTFAFAVHTLSILFAFLPIHDRVLRFS